MPGDPITTKGKSSPVISKPLPGPQPIISPLDGPPQIPINMHWKELNGAPGNPVSAVEPLANGHRIRYEHGAIYLKTKGKPAWVYGAIGERYDAMGGVNSWLGFPLTDEQPFDDNGRVSVFEKGCIYWWPDVGAIEMNEVLVQYAGLHCFGETNDQPVDFIFGGSNSDEPYVILGIVSPPNYSNTVTSQIYNGVDAGESNPDSIDLYKGSPYGLIISGTLMEHDEGDPDKYKDEVQQAVAKGADVIDVGIGYIPVIGPPLAQVAKPFLDKAVPAVAAAVNNLLGTGDDQISPIMIQLSAKDMIVCAGQNPPKMDDGPLGLGLVINLQSPLLSGDGGSYKVGFRLVRA